MRTFIIFTFMAWTYDLGSVAQTAPLVIKLALALFIFLGILMAVAQDIRDLLQEPK